MRKTLLYLVLLVTLAFGVYYFIFKGSDSPFSSKEASFTIRDTASIGKIFLARANGESITLERSNGGWILNNKYPALAGITKGLLATLHDQSAIAPIPESAHNNIIKGMAGTSVKVELYDNAGQKMRVFYVGGEAYHNGTYMLMEGASTAYVVQILGFTGYLTPRYSTDWKDWRDRTVSNVSPEQIQSVTIQYTNEPLNSFTVQQSNDSLTVIGDPVITRNKKLNEHRTRSFLKFFQNLNLEGYVTGTSPTDSVIKPVDKRCSIDIKSKQGQQHVDVYWMPLNRRSKNLLTPMPNHPNQYDADHFYAVLNNYKDTAVIQRFTFDKIFRACFEFYTPDEEK